MRQFDSLKIAGPSADSKVPTLTPGKGEHSDLIGRLSLSITRLARVLRQQESTRLTPTAAAALATIVRHGPMSLGDLATAEQVSPSTITKLVNKLRTDGFIELVVDHEDRRVHRVRLSAAGRRRIDAYRSKRNAWLSAQLEQLTDGDRAKVVAVLDVLERLTDAAGPDPLGDIED